MTNTPYQSGSVPPEPESWSTSTPPGQAEAATWPPSPSGSGEFGSSAPEAGRFDPSSGPSDESSDSTADAAKEEAAAVKDTAVEAGKDVAATAQSEATKVAGEAKQQAKSLLSSVTDEVSAQAGTQQQRVASQVQSLSQELTGMASGSSESGPLTDLAHQAGQRGGEIATWLSEHEPKDVLREVQSFARRRPVTFLVLCGVAGVVAGRLTRGAVAANTDLDNPKKQATNQEPARRALSADTATYATTDPVTGSGYSDSGHSGYGVTGSAGQDPALGGVPAPGSGVGGSADRPGGVL